MTGRHNPYPGVDLPPKNPPCATIAGDDGSDPEKNSISAPQVIVIVLVFSFTGWLLSRGLTPPEALAVAAAAVTIAAAAARGTGVPVLTVSRRIAAVLASLGTPA